MQPVVLAAGEVALQWAIVRGAMDQHLRVEDPRLSQRAHEGITRVAPSLDLAVQVRVELLGHHQRAHQQTKLGALPVLVLDVDHVGFDEVEMLVVRAARDHVEAEVVNAARGGSDGVDDLRGRGDQAEQVAALDLLIVGHRHPEPRSVDQAPDRVHGRAHGEVPLRDRDLLIASSREDGGALRGVAQGAKEDTTHEGTGGHRGPRARGRDGARCLVQRIQKGANRFVTHLRGALVSRGSRRRAGPRPHPRA